MTFSSDHLSPYKSEFKVPHPLANVKVPEDWGTLEEFTQWYLDAGMPWAIPASSRTIFTDNAASLILFRKGAYQVELYLIKDGTDIPMHEHPNMEVIQMVLLNRYRSTSDPHDVDPLFGKTTPKLYPGDYHGSADGEVTNTFCLLTFEKWLKYEPGTASSEWKGRTVGPLHDALIKGIHPNATVVNGTADSEGTVSEDVL